jgi:uncharacterized protein DUF3854
MKGLRMRIPEIGTEHTGTERTLSPEHRRTLEVLSAIACDVIGARGVYSVEWGRDLPAVFSRRQRGRGPGILFTVHRPDGSTTWQYRPDGTDPDHPGLKYEAGCKSRGAPGNTLDVHPYCRKWIEDPSVPVVFVEGIKKADSILSAAREAGERLVVVAISGVWNWLSDGEPIPDIFGIPLRKREVRVCFDSDVFTNPDVADAARRLAGHLRERGAASVLLAYLPQARDEAKVGADDYLAAGHSYADLAGCFKPFDADDLATERLRRSHHLRARLDDLWRKLWAMECRGMGDYSVRDLYKVLCDVAAERGRLHPDGLRVRISWRELIPLVRISSKTLRDKIPILENMGLVYRDNAGRKAEDRGAFVLVTSVGEAQSDKVNHRGQGTATKGGESKSPQCLHAGGLPRRFTLSAPRLPWSTPGRKAHRGTVPGTRRVRDSVTPAREPVKRLGKRRGALLDVIEASGGFAPVEEAGFALNLKRPRELVRFRRSAKGKDGTAVMLLEAGVIEWVSDVATRRESLRLANDWLERLADIDDLEADRLRRRIWHEKDREGFRKYRERARPKHSASQSRVDPTPRPIEASTPEPERNPRSGSAVPPISDLARATRDYLERNPGAVREHGVKILPGWLAGTLWAYDLYPGNPTPANVREAIAELGGERYLCDRLRAGTPRREEYAA